MTTTFQFVTDATQLHNSGALIVLLGDTIPDHYPSPLQPHLATAQKLSWLDDKHIASFHPLAEGIDLLLVIKPKWQYSALCDLFTKIVQQILAAKQTTLTIDLHAHNLTSQQFRDCLVALSHCCYQYTQYKSDKSSPCIEQVRIIANSDNKADFNYANTLNRSLQVCKNLANAPANLVTPSYLASQAEVFAQQNANLTVQIVDETDFAKLGLNAFLFVSQGSQQNGKLIVLHYQGATETNTPTYALIGKGVTFDTGGISLKPPAKMDEMKYDMCGAATVFSVLHAVTMLDLKINLVVAMACAENMPSGNAGKPGDIVTSLSGQTIEVLNTDAEGRLVLCDTMTYVQNQYRPQVMIDVATLTGACIVALGHHYAAVFANNDKLAQDLITAANSSSDPAWRMPMNDTFHKQLKSPFADIANIGNLPAAQSSVAACFLEKFCQDGCDWAHLDIAGVAWNSGANKQATGRPVRLLLDYLITQITH